MVVCSPGVTARDWAAPENMTWCVLSWRDGARLGRAGKHDMVV